MDVLRLSWLSRISYNIASVQTTSLHYKKCGDGEKVGPCKRMCLLYLGVCASLLLSGMFGDILHSPENLYGHKKKVIRYKY